MKPDKSNTFCHYPFIQTSVNFWDKEGIKIVAPCCNCVNPSNPDPLKTYGKYNSLEQAFYGDEMSTVRQQMLNGEKPDVCKGCYKSEEFGTSPRLQLDDSDIEEYDVNNPSIQWLDIHVGEKCNLACRHCHPHLSNRLRDDALAFVERGYDYSADQPDWWKLEEPYLDSKNLFQVIDLTSEAWNQVIAMLPNIKHIRVSGGETLYSSAVNHLMSVVMKQYPDQINLELYTNATRFSLHNNFKLRKFKQVDLTVSIDGTEKTYEYIRHPMRWEIIQNNFNCLFKWNDNFKSLNINFVANTYNVLNIADTIKWFEQFEKPFDFIISNIYPEGRNIDPIWLPRDILEKTLEQLEPYLDKYQVKNFYERIKQNLDTYSEDKLKRLKRETLAFDTNRKQSYRDFCHPDIVDFLDSIDEK